MPVPSRLRPLAPTACACGLVLAMAGVAAAQRHADPVDDLRRALEGPAPYPAERAARLEACVEVLGGVDQLGRALLLSGWRDADPSPEAAHADARQRAALARRFEEAVGADLRGGDDATRLAAVRALLAVATADRDVVHARHMGRAFGADLAVVTRDGPVGLRLAAAEALGRINPDPDVAAPACDALLRASDPALRVAGARALAALTRTASNLALRPADDAAAVKPADAAGAARAAVSVAGPHLGDPDVRLRRACAGVMEQGALAFARLALGPPLPAPEVRRADFARPAQLVAGDLAALAVALTKLTPELVRALGDDDAAVRLTTRRALEDLASARRPTADKGAAGDPLAEVLRAAAVALGEDGPDANATVRRSSIELLETLGPDAAPAAARLVRALADPDRFVRWSAARALSRVGPVEPASAVPALARLLGDPDSGVRQAAAAALERYGPEAKPATAALVDALREPDAGTKLAVLEALDAIGPEGPDAIAALKSAATDPDLAVRDSAADILARWGGKP